MGKLCHQGRHLILQAPWRLSLGEAGSDYTPPHSRNPRAYTSTALLLAHRNDPLGAARGLDEHQVVPSFIPFCLSISFFFFFFPCPAPFHSSPLFPWLIHAFPGAFYHCHCFPRSPLIRGAVTRVSVGGWQMVAAAGPGQGSSITAGPALEGLSRSKVIVGGEEAFFTADEEERCGVVLMPW